MVKKSEISVKYPYYASLPKDLARDIEWYRLKFVRKYGEEKAPSFVIRKAMKAYERELEAKKNRKSGSIKN